ncbi:hypothetical protein M9434_006183 [Picochlorum sp. BPE23]|nr:hypothetical protein M9434_006183 [Picochlorum sp. BPE23]
MLVFALSCLGVTAAPPLSIDDVQEGKPCGDHWDGEWMKVSPNTMSGPGTSRVGQCVVGGTYVSAKVGPWSNYDLLEVLYRDPSTYVDGEEQTQQTKVYATGDWSRWQDSVANGSLDLSDLLDMSELYGRGSTKLSDDMLRVDRVRPAEGSHVVFVPAPQEDSVTLCDVWVCAIQRDFDGRGEPITSRGALISSGRNGQSERIGKSITEGGIPIMTGVGPGLDVVTPTCPDGKGVQGEYTSMDCRARCYGTIGCKDGDVEIAEVADCGIGPLGTYCKAKRCGACGCVDGEFVRSELLSVNYPSSPSDIISTGNSVESSADVVNRGSTKQSITMSFDFSSTVQTSMKLTNSSEVASKVSLKIPVPKIGLNLGVEAGDVAELTNGETTKSGSKMSFKYSYGVAVDPFTRLKATGTIFSKTVTIKVPVTYKIYDSCGGNYDVTDTAVMTSSGVISESSSEIRVRYDSEPTDNAPTQ